MQEQTHLAGHAQPLAAGAVKQAVNQLIHRLDYGSMMELSCCKPLADLFLAVPSLFLTSNASLHGQLPQRLLMMHIVIDVIPTDMSTAMFRPLLMLCA